MIYQLENFLAKTADGPTDQKTCEDLEKYFYQLEYPKKMLWEKNSELIWNY